jgi:small subunit ribosomal protein S3Ae
MPKKKGASAGKKKKEKKWYKVLSSPEFGEKEIGESLAAEPEKIIGRKIEVSLDTLTGNLKQTHIKILFRINKVEGTEARTEFIGNTMANDYVRRLTRSERDKIDSSFVVKVKTGEEFRVKPFIITIRKIQTSKKKALREIIQEETKKFSEEKDKEEFVKSVVNSELASHCYGACKKVSPIRRIEVWKTTLLHP